MIRQVQEYSQIGIEHKTFTLVDLNVVLKEVVEELKNQITSTNTTIDVDFLPTIEGNKEEISRLFNQLIFNSIKFRKEGIPPEIHIRCTHTNKDIVIILEDNGIGIDEKFIPHNF